MEQLEFWTNVAVVVLGIQCFVILIVGVALSYLLVRVMSLLHARTEVYATKLQQVTHTVNERTQTYSDKGIQPVLAVRKQATRAGQTLRSLFGR